MNEHINLLITGDVLIEKKIDINYSQEIKKLISCHNYFCCNLEGPIATPLQKKSLDDDCKVCQSKESIDGIIKAGINIVSLANNHIMNYDVLGLKNTINYLEEKNVSYFGAGLTWENAYRPIILNNSNVIVGLINVADPQYGTCNQYGGRGYADCFDTKVYKIIQQLVEKCDHVIVVCHAGLEDVEVPLPEWRDNYKNFIDMGVSCVIAHHPHVLQGWEDYGNGRIYYSLGNFIWESDKVKSCIDPTIMVSLQISKENIAYKEYPIKYDSGNISLIYDKNVYRHMQYLCEILNNEDEYIKLVNDSCQLIYDRWYKNKFFSLVGQSPWDSFKHIIKNIIIFFKHGFKEDDRKIWLFCENTTLRYVIKRIIVKRNRWHI